MTRGTRGTGCGKSPFGRAGRVRWAAKARAPCVIERSSTGRSDVATTRTAYDTVSYPVDVRSGLTHNEAGQSGYDSPSYHPGGHMSHTDPAMEECIRTCLDCPSTCLRTLAHCLDKGGDHARPGNVPHLPASIGNRSVRERGC